MQWCQDCCVSMGDSTAPPFAYLPITWLNYVINPSSTSCVSFPYWNTYFFIYNQSQYVTWTFNPITTNKWGLTGRGKEEQQQQHWAERQQEESSAAETRNVFSEGNDIVGAVTFTLTREIRVKSLQVKVKGGSRFLGGIIWHDQSALPWPLWVLPSQKVLGGRKTWRYVNLKRHGCSDLLYLFNTRMEWHRDDADSFSLYFLHLLVCPHVGYCDDNMHTRQLTP